MATSAEYAAFVCEQVQRFGSIRSRKMFGEYMVYCDERPILLVCDDSVFIKKWPQLEPLMAGAECGLPYDGTKEQYILDIESAELLDAVIPLLCELTPLPKKRKKVT